ncbi:MAG TPA: hypothetical protein VMG80_02395 [Solirubrobacteraceae bacterium]|nr:hypothetical protein [Solirubrobacteraceae bacterium]
MPITDRMRAWRRRASLSLTQEVALLSLVPIMALGVALALILQAQVVKQTLTDADESAQLIARIGVQPRLSKQDLKNGLSEKEVHKLDEQLSGRSVTKDLARLKIWNTKDRVIYSDDKQLLGRTLTPSDDLVDALADHPHPAVVVNPRPHTETASEVGLGRLVEVTCPCALRGIETRQAWERLESLGCDVGQGYWIGRPMPAVELTERLLAQGPETPTERPSASTCEAPGSAAAHTSLQLR